MATPAMLITRLSSLLFLTALLCTLFFNGFQLQFFALGMSLLLGWGALGLWRHFRAAQAFNLSPLLLAGGAFLLFLLLSLLYHPVPYLGQMNLWWVGAFVLVLWFYSLYPEQEALWRQLQALILLLVVVLAGVGLFQHGLMGLAPEAVFYNKNSLAALINLALLPLLAVFLRQDIAPGTAPDTARAAPHRRLQHLALAAAIVLFALLLGIINSRGALLGFLLACGLLLLLVYGHVRTPALLRAGGLILSGFVLAYIYQHLLMPGSPDTLSRLTTLADPLGAGQTRFVLWLPALEMLKDNPLSGIGLGAYFLTLPATPELLDTSAGFYVHNDYLQVAAETGLPGLLLLLLIPLALFWQLRRLLQARPPTAQRLEAAGLVAGLAALGLHSVFTYNFYILPIMLIAGLYLGRFNQLYVAHAATGPAWHSRQLAIRAHFTPTSFYLVLLGGILLAGGYFYSLALADRYHQRGIQLSAQNHLQQAHFAFEKAQSLSPRQDNSYYVHAQLLLNSAELLEANDLQRQALLAHAQSKLDTAARLNPYQAFTPYLLGRHAELSGQSTDAARTYYQTALARNQRFLPARLALAKTYRHTDPQQALAVLRDGLGYPYRSLTPELLEYVQLTATLAHQTQAAELAQRLDERLARLTALYAGSVDTARPAQRY